VIYIILYATIILSISLILKAKDREFAETLNILDWDELGKEKLLLSNDDAE
jgi:hypothetical protein